MGWMVTYRNKDITKVQICEYEPAINLFQRLMKQEEESGDITNVELWKRTLSNDDIKQSKDNFKRVKEKEDNVINYDV